MVMKSNVENLKAVIPKAVNVSQNAAVVAVM